jgi:hypothetical protein
MIFADVQQATWLGATPSVQSLVWQLRVSFANLFPKYEV